MQDTVPCIYIKWCESIATGYLKTALVDIGFVSSSDDGTLFNALTVTGQFGFLAYQSVSEFLTPNLEICFLYYNQYILRSLSYENSGYNAMFSALFKILQACISFFVSSTVANGHFALVFE